MSMNMVYTKHMEELQTYLQSKLPELPVHTAQEIAAHIANKTNVLVNDMLMEYDRELRAAAYRRERRYEDAVSAAKRKMEQEAGGTSNAQIQR